MFEEEEGEGTFLDGWGLPTTRDEEDGEKKAHSLHFQISVGEKHLCCFRALSAPRTRALLFD